MVEQKSGIDYNWEKNAACRKLTQEQKDDFFPLAKAENVETKLATFQKKLLGKSDFWLKSKYLGLFLFKVIQGKESLVTQSLITYASSQDDLSSAHLKLM